MKKISVLLCVFLSLCLLSSPARAQLIIDAGHGGADGGAVSLNGYKESLINLNIALKMDAIAGLYGIAPLLTRASEEIGYSESSQTIKAKKVEDQKNRVSLINGTADAFLISIHQNKYSTAAPRGAQVFYGANEIGRGFALFLQPLLKEALSLENSREAVGIDPSIYLFQKISCPAVLVECGFLSNPEDEALLLSDNYQLKLAAVIMAAYLQYYPNGDLNENS